MLGESSQCEIRLGRPSDAPALCEIFRETWTHAYRGIIPHLHLESMIRRRTTGWWKRTIKSGDGLLVLDVDGSVAGYATMGAARTRGHHEGEIYEIYVVPSHQGLGFGEQLFETCRHHLDMRQLCGLVVWALVDNSMATDFYWNRGGRPFELTLERFGDQKLQKIAFAWE